MNMTQIPMSTSQMFTSEPHRTTMPANMIGMPRRADQFLFESPLSIGAQQGEWINKFATMSPRSSLNTPEMIVSTPQSAVAASDVVSNYAHGFQNTLVLNEPLWNENYTLMGQPIVPVDPHRMCPTSLSSHGKLGYLSFMNPEMRCGDVPADVSPSWFMGDNAVYDEK